MDSYILVDGYNVIKNNLMFQSLETKSLMEARYVLIRQLKNRYRHTMHHVIIVFDGNGAKEQESHDDHIRIIFSRYGETADCVIIRLTTEARRAGHEVQMYSNDEEVRQTVARQGGNIHTTGQLVRQLNAPSHDVAIRSHHRQVMRRVYGMDPSHKPEDELEYDSFPRKKKGKSSRRHR